jgi:DNA-directed RNA polymerase subunit beta
MGANLQGQTVSLMRSARLIVSTGLEGLVVGEPGHVVHAAEAGLVSSMSGMYIDVVRRINGNQFLPRSALLPLKQGKTHFPGFTRLPVKATEGARKEVSFSRVWPEIKESRAQEKRRYTLQAYDRSNQETAMVQSPSVSEGDWVLRGDLLADCAASMQGGLALGHNLMIAYVPWDGYNFEDAVVISERLVHSRKRTGWFG